MRLSTGLLASFAAALLCLPPGAGGEPTVHGADNSDTTTHPIGRRVEQAQSAIVESPTLGGQTTLAGALATLGGAIADATRSIKQLLGGSSFALELSDDGVMDGMTLWGAGDYREGAGENTNSAIDWGRNRYLSGAHLGVDARLSNSLLAGAAVSWNEGDADHEIPGANDDQDELQLASVYPYLGWSAPDGNMHLWAAAGYGEGDLGSARASKNTAAVGGSSLLLRTNAGAVHLKGEALITELNVDDATGINARTVDTQRVRASLKWSHERAMAGDGQLHRAINIGLLHDSGNGRDGAEVGLGLRYQSAVRGLTVEGRSRALLTHSGAYSNWGVSGVVRFRPGRDGRGLSFNLEPGMASANESNPGARMNLELGYGMLRHGRMITPYGRATLSDGRYGYRLGGRLKADGLEMSLEGSAKQDPGALFKTRLRW